MVDFGKTNYSHAMDSFEPNEKVDVRDLGASAGFGDPLESLKGELSGGAGHVEIVFTGAGKGSLGQNRTTPEMFGKVKREDIRLLAKLNDATLSTHASIAISGVAGTSESSTRCQIFSRSTRTP